MDLTQILTSYGYWGMFLAAILAGSVFPFSSEAVMLALLAAGLSPIELTLYGTAGNLIGSLINYSIGRMGKLEWIERYLHVSKEKLDRAIRFMNGRGAWMGFFCFLPILGTAIAIALGLMRSNLLITTFSMMLGKFARYFVLIGGVELIFG